MLVPGAGQQCLLPDAPCWGQAGAVVNSPKPSCYGLTPPELLLLNVVLEVRLLAGRVSLAQPALLFYRGQLSQPKPHGQDSPACGRSHGPSGLYQPPAEPWSLHQ